MEPFIAEIKLFAGNFAPRGWHDCDGTILPIASYQALFALIGTTYGGDGRQTFTLPKLAPPTNANGEPIGRYIIALTGIFPSRE